MNFTKLTLFLAASTLSVSAFAKTEVSRILLGDRTVEAGIDAPKGEGPHPLLVIAPDVPEDVAFGEKLVKSETAAGFVTIRLRWAFGNAKKGTAAKPSADLLREAEELSVVLEQLSSARMMKKYEIDPDKIALVSNGFGSKIAMMKESGAFSPKVKAHFVIEPVCEKKTSFKTAYAPLLSADVSRFILASSASSCPLTEIKESKEGAKGRITIHTTEGKSANFSKELPLIHTWIESLGWNTKKVEKKAEKKHDHKHSH